MKTRQLRKRAQARQSMHVLPRSRLAVLRKWLSFCGTATGSMTGRAPSQKPARQDWPTRAGFPAEARTFNLIDADYSDLERRIAVFWPPQAQVAQYTRADLAFLNTPGVGGVAHPISESGPTD